MLNMAQIEEKIAERISATRIADLDPESRGYSGGFVVKDEEDLFGVARVEIMVDKSSAGGLAPKDFFDGQLVLGQLLRLTRSGWMKYGLEVIPDPEDPDVSIFIGHAEVVFYLPIASADAEGIADYNREFELAPYEKEEI